MRYCSHPHEVTHFSREARITRMKQGQYLLRCEIKMGLRGTWLKHDGSSQFFLEIS